MTESSVHRPLAEPFSTGASWLARAVVVSALLHVVVALAWWLVRADDKREVELVDIELAPPPPKAEALPAEIAKQPESAPAAQAQADEPVLPNEPGEDMALGDAGVDAPVDAPSDAAPRKKRRADAGVDAGVDADGDEPMLAGGDLDAGTEVAMIDPGTGAGTGAGADESDGGVPAALEHDAGAGVAGMDHQPAVDGAPTSAGTAANLLAYFPPGHQVTVLIRFDRLRKTEWQEPAARLFKPMPDYRALFGSRDAAIAEKLDMLVISSPSPRDATATTLVGHTRMTRAQMRDFLANPDTPIQWSATQGGLLGRRSGKLFPNDKRVLLSPWRGWFVLAQPADLGGVTRPAGGSLDTVEAKAKLPAWLAQIRTIGQESGDEQRGPALVLTLKGPGQRYTIPDVGIGVTSAPSPDRVSLAMELVKQGWLVRGNIVFATEADAAEFVQTAQDV